MTTFAKGTICYLAKGALDDEPAVLRVVGNYPEFHNAIKVVDDKGREGIYTRADLVSVAEREAVRAGVKSVEDSLD